MSYTQLTPFDPSKGGNVPNLCLDNVRRGYGIGNKYGSAWEAWEHTQKHPDRNVPVGVAVPIYYSYTVDLGDGPQNYGHINVQLPDGRVWSDGNYYTSIDGYMAHHDPKYVGWGESVNDVQVIKQGGDMVTDSELDFDVASQTFKDCTGRALTRAEFANQVGRSWQDVLITFQGSPETATWTAKANNNGSKATVLKPGTYQVN